MTTARPGGGFAAGLVPALVEGRAVTRAMATELLTHLPDVGEVATQRLLDAWVEQAADTLLALSDALEERILEIGAGRSHPDRARPVR